MRRVIDVSDRVRRITTADRQLVIHPADENAEPLTIPAEDVGLLVLDTGRVSVSTSSLRRLSQAGAAVLLTDERHLPLALLLPFASHTRATARLWAQISASVPRRKQAWSQIVTAKIRAQAANCTLDYAVSERLHGLSRTVRSGDPENREGEAAALYWRVVSGDPEFRRRPRSEEPRNVFLDYGYGVLRAACARALVCAGLHPAIGVNHHARDNPFCLADDLMEPLRPLVDRVALGLYERGVRELGRDARGELLRCLTHTVYGSAGSGPLEIALERYASSLAVYLEGEGSRIDIPVVP